MRTCPCCTNDFVHERIDTLLKPEIVKQVTFAQYSNNVCLVCVQRFIGRPLTENDHVHVKAEPLPFCAMPENEKLNTHQKLIDFYRFNAKYDRRNKQVVLGVSLRKFSKPLFLEPDCIAIGYAHGESAYPAILLINRYPFDTLPRPLCLNAQVHDFAPAMRICNQLLTTAIREWMDKNVQVKRYCESCKDYTIIKGKCEVCPK